MSTIATQISLVKYAGPIFNQLSQGSCVANAYCGVVALQAKEYHVTIPKLSVQFTYNDTRILMGTFPSDSGSSVASAQKSVMTNGMAYDSLFTYGGGNESVIPSAAVYSDAATKKVLSFTSLSIYQPYTGIAKTIGEQLMHGKAVLVTAMIHTGFGVDPNSITSPLKGLHEYAVVGIDYSTSTYTVMNSWGTNWAQGGFGKIKFSDLPGIDPLNSPYGVDLYHLDVMNGFAGVDLTWTAERTQASQLYVSMFDRAGEKAGTVYWGDIIKTGVTYTDVARYFYHSTEGQAKYGSMANAQFLNEIYHNIMNRDVDAPGLAYWTDMLNKGMDRGELVGYISNFIATYNGTDAQTLLEKDFLINSTTVSMNYGITMQVDGTHYAASVHALQGVTSDANTVQVSLVGIQHELGWA